MDICKKNHNWTLHQLSRAFETIIDENYEDAIYFYEDALASEKELLRTIQEESKEEITLAEKMLSRSVSIIQQDIYELMLFMKEKCHE